MKNEDVRAFVYSLPALTLFAWSMALGDTTAKFLSSLFLMVFLLITRYAASVDESIVSKSSLDNVNMRTAKLEAMVDMSKHNVNVLSDSVHAVRLAIEKKSLVPDAMEKVVNQVNELTIEQAKLRDVVNKMAVLGAYKGMVNG